VSTDPKYTPDEVAALEAVGHASAMSRNDPDYYAGLEEQARDIEGVANEVKRVTLVDRGRQGSYIQVDPARPRNRPAVMTTAATMARLFEAEFAVDRSQAGPAPGDSGLARSSQPPRHTHYKDDRPDNDRKGSR
jgi:hypothetical protein